MLNRGQGYRIEKVVICEGTQSKLPYINHMLIVGPNGGRLILDEEYSTGVIKSICKNQLLSARDVVNVALNIGMRMRWCIIKAPHIPKSTVKYSLLAKQCGARVATVDEYRALKKDIEAASNINTLVGQR